VNVGAARALRELEERDCELELELDLERERRRDPMTHARGRRKGGERPPAVVRVCAFECARREQPCDAARSTQAGEN